MLVTSWHCIGLVLVNRRSDGHCKSKHVLTEKQPLPESLCTKCPHRTVSQPTGPPCGLQGTCVIRLSGFAASFFFKL